MLSCKAVQRYMSKGSITSFSDANSIDSCNQ